MAISPVENGDTGAVARGKINTAALDTDLTAHTADVANPHVVTAAQVGAPDTATFTAHTGDASIHFADALSDGKEYARKDNAWVEVVGTVEEAPEDGKEYGRKDAGWVEITTTGVPEAPQDSTPYVRIDATWASADGLYDAIGAAAAVQGSLDAHTADATVHYADAPADSSNYVRNNNAWAALGTIPSAPYAASDVDISANWTVAQQNAQLRIDATTLAASYTPDIEALGAAVLVFYGSVNNGQIINAPTNMPPGTVVELFFENPGSEVISFVGFAPFGDLPTHNTTDPVSYTVTRIIGNPSPANDTYELEGALKGATGLRIPVDSVTDLFGLTSVKDDELIETVSYTSGSNNGGNVYRYDSSSTETIDGVEVLPGVGGVLSFDSAFPYAFNGTAGTGRYIARDRTQFTLHQAGAVGEFREQSGSVDGTTTITADSAFFSAADVGKLLAFDDGDTDNTYCGGTIQTYISPTQVTIDVAAPYTATGTIAIFVDDTSAIVRCLATKSAIVPPGTFCGSYLNILHGTHLRGHGKKSVIRNLPDQPKFARLLTTTLDEYSGLVDSDPIRISDLTLDGSRQYQGPYTGFELEQQHLIFLTKQTGASGRLVSQISNVRFRDSCGDGLAIQDANKITAVNLESWNNFRGGFTVLGGDNELTITNMVIDGDVHPGGFDFESSGVGPISGTAANNSSISNIVMNGDFDCAVEEGSTLLVTNVQNHHPSSATEDGFFNLYAPNSFVQLTNCTFDVGDAGTINQFNRLLISGCRFIVTKTQDDAGPYYGLNFGWGAGGSSIDGARAIISNCIIEMEEPLANYGGSTHRGVYSPNIDAGQSNIVEIHDSYIKGFRRGFYISRNNHFTCRNTIFEDIDTTAFHVTAATGQESTLVIDGCRLRGTLPDWWLQSGAVDSDVVTVEHQNITLDEGNHNRIAGTGGGTSNQVWRGSRTLMLDHDPTVTSTGGVIGDVAKHITAVAEGEPYEWECFSNSHSLSTWQERHSRQAKRYKELATPPSGLTDNAVVYAEDNGSGKTRLMVQFQTGVAQQIAIEP